MNSLFRDYEIVIRSGLFDPDHYLATYPDVARRNVDPLMHYLEEGARGARNPHPDFDAAFYLAQCRQHGHNPENPLLHYITVGAGLGLKTKPDRSTPALTATPAETAAAAEPAGRLPMQLYLDEAEVTPDGVLRVVGWVVCLAPVAAVELLLDDASLGGAEIGRPRPDVEKIRSEYPNARRAGFLFVGDVRGFGAGAKTIRVRATAQTGIVREQTQRIDIADVEPRVAAPEAATRYHCDEVLLTTSGRLSLRGWVVGASPAIAIDVLVDGVAVGHAEGGLERADVGNLFPALPHARLSGFVADLQCKRPLSGEHQVTLRLRQRDERVEDIILPVLAVEREAEAAVVPGVAAPVVHQLVVDTPMLLDGAAETPIRGNFEISGWALARDGVAAVEIMVDGTLLTTADYGIRRLDVQSAFPDWDNTLESGFMALVPHRTLRHGPHQVAVVLRDKSGDTVSVDFRIVVEPLPDMSGPWVLRRRMPAAALDLGRRLLARRQWHPTFEVLIAVSEDTALRDVCTTLISLRSQVYDGWRLSLRWDRAAGSTDPWAERLSDELAALGEKARVIDAYAAENMPPGTAYLAVLTPGCELGCDALHEMALATASDSDADFFYSDERRPNPGSGEVEAFFKPDWSPDLLLSTNYVGQLWCARGDLVRRAAAADENLLDLGAYDLVLRLTEAAGAIRHVPSVLCEHQATLPEAPELNRRALEDAVHRRGIAAEVLPGLVGGTYRLKRTPPSRGLVSIIIPTRAARGMIERCIETIRTSTNYPHIEIVCIENIPLAQAHWRDWLEDHADEVLSADEPFNWSRFNNRAAAAAQGEYLLFLNDDIEIDDPEWLDMLLAQAQRPEVGVVGPLLLYPDRRIQHAGMFLADMAQARHAFRYAAEDDPGYFGLALTERDVMAVTGACLLTRRDTFERLGGFDEAHDIVNNDLDYCLKAWEAGLRTIYTPHTRLIHHEAVSRAAVPDAFDVEAFDKKWREIFLRGDPYFSPHLSKSQDAVAPDGEPNHVVVTGRPALPRDQIRNILAVKLDHIGDCILAFPALRRLKRHFPEARITVLTSRASRPVWALEPAVDAVLEFDFFHARSSDGELSLGDEDWRRLAGRLRPEAFDLAIDLRRHLETRTVLQHSGARWLAGVDYRNRFPWLDVAIEWTGDPAFVHKRQHAVDDLINLVDAVAASCETDRTLIAVGAPEASRALAGLLPPADERPLVGIHPTAGNDMKQWPLAYFAAVADRLVVEHDARIVLIGAPGEETAGAALLGTMRRADAAVSLIGALPLGQLPALLGRCTLFLGNDSGPKHIAAGLGVPTVSVQAGSVDVYEWGPVGPLAVAVVRDMTCAPCYLPKPEDCRRGLACLRRLTPDAVYAACNRLLLRAVAGG